MLFASRKWKPMDSKPKFRCCWCFKVCKGNYRYSIDVPGEIGGPDLPLCYQHGSKQWPSVQEIHARLLAAGPLTIALLHVEMEVWGTKKKGVCHLTL
jgi:hypothetical protein